MSLMTFTNSSFISLHGFVMTSPLTSQDSHECSAGNKSLRYTALEHLTKCNIHKKVKGIKKLTDLTASNNGL